MSIQVLRGVFGGEYIRYSGCLFVCHSHDTTGKEVESLHTMSKLSAVSFVCEFLWLQRHQHCRRRRWSCAHCC